MLAGCCLLRRCCWPVREGFVLPAMVLAASKLLGLRAGYLAAGSVFLSAPCAARQPLASGMVACI